MKMYLPFGDWSNDGHGRYEKLLIDAPSMEHLKRAQDRIIERYDNKFFFSEFAENYDEPYLSEAVWRAVIDAGYPIERLAEMQDDVRYDECNTWDEVFALGDADGLFVTLDTVMDIFIFLLNAYGAEITRLDNGEDIPMICNWTCHGFQTVGYGCFY